MVPLDPMPKFRNYLPSKSEIYCPKEKKWTLVKQQNISLKKKSKRKFLKDLSSNEKNVSNWIHFVKKIKVIPSRRKTNVSKTFCLKNTKNKTSSLPLKSFSIKRKKKQTLVKCFV